MSCQRLNPVHCVEYRQQDGILLQASTRGDTTAFRGRLATLRTIFSVVILLAVLMEGSFFLQLFLFLLVSGHVI